MTRFALTSPRPDGRPSPVGEGQARLGWIRLEPAAWIVSVAAISLACGGPANDNAVIPSRQDLAQASGALLPGKTYDNREKIRQGMRSAELSAALGAPSEKLESRGQILSGHWTYLYKDGKIVINLRDGIVTEVETTFY